MSKRGKRLLFGFLVGIAAISILAGGIWFAWSQSKYGRSEQLIAAIKAGNREKAAALLDSGVDPNVPNGRQTFLRTMVELSISYPLSVACSEDDPEMVALLLRYGADPALSPEGGWDPVEATVLRLDEHDLDILQLLDEYGASFSRESGEEPYVFLAADVLGQHTRPDGETDVSYYNEAAGVHITQVVDYLLKDSASVPRYSSYTLLMTAARWGNTALIRDLLDRGEDPSAADAQGKTAYDYAVEHGQDAAAALLTPINRAETGK